MVCRRRAPPPKPDCTTWIWNHATLDLLADRGFKDARAAAHSCILQAASHFGLHVIAGEQDEGLRATALHAARACADLDPPRRERFLSPRFLGFYDRALALSEEEVPALPGEERDAVAVEPGPLDQPSPG